MRTRRLIPAAAVSLAMVSVVDAGETDYQQTRSVLWVRHLTGDRPDWHEIGTYKSMALSLERAKAAVLEDRHILSAACNQPHEYTECALGTGTEMLCIKMVGRSPPFFEQ